MSEKLQAKRSGGVALVLTLILLIILTIVGVATMSASSLQERMAGNQKRITDSSMAAEAGILNFFSELAAAPALWESTPTNAPAAFGVEGASATNQFQYLSWQTRSGNLCQAGSQECELIVRGDSLDAAGTVLASTTLSAVFEYSESATPEGGGADILCGGSLDLGANMDITNAWIHCNGLASDVDARGGQSTMRASEITSNGTLSKAADGGFRCPTDDCSSAGSAGIDNPPPPFFDRVQQFVDELRGQVGGSDPYTVTFEQRAVDGQVLAEFPVELTNDTSGDQSLDSMDLSNRDMSGCDSAPTLDLQASSIGSDDVIFFNGNVNILGAGTTPVSNATIIAACDIIHNGRLTQDGSNEQSEVNNVFLAGRDQEFNGTSGPFEGRFLLGNNVEFNGGVTMKGQVIAGGDINVNGGLVFEGAEALGGNADLLIEISLRQIEWAQLW